MKCLLSIFPLWVFSLLISKFLIYCRNEPPWQLISSSYSSTYNLIWSQYLYLTAGTYSGKGINGLLIRSLNISVSSCLSVVFLLFPLFLGLNWLEPSYSPLFLFFSCSLEFGIPHGSFINLPILHVLFLDYFTSAASTTTYLPMTSQISL